MCWIAGRKKIIISILIYLNRIRLAWPKNMVRFGEKTPYIQLYSSREEKKNSIVDKFNFVVAVRRLLSRREFGRLQYATVHLTNQWHCVGNTFIPTGRTPCSFATFLTILQRFVTLKKKMKENLDSDMHRNYVGTLTVFMCVCETERMQ